MYQGKYEPRNRHAVLTSETSFIPSLSSLTMSLFARCSKFLESYNNIYHICTRGQNYPCLQFLVGFH